MIQPDRTSPNSRGPERADAWSPVSDRAIGQAISRWELDKVGWRGFESLPWVTALHKKYPAVPRIASTCSSHDNRYRDEVTELLGDIEPADFGDVKSYFVGKLALEELSCRLSGAGGGMCDKRAAYLVIFDMMKQRGEPIPPRGG